MARARGPRPAKQEDLGKQREIGERIRHLRKEKLRLDQAELAGRLGVSHAAVSYWERGGNPHPTNLRSLAKLAGVTMEWLTNGVDATALDPRIQEIADRLVGLDEADLDRYFRAFNEMLDLRGTLITGSRLNSKKL